MVHDQLMANGCEKLMMIGKIIANDGLFDGLFDGLWCVAADGRFNGANNWFANGLWLVN